MKVRLHEPTFGEEEIHAVVDVMRSTNITSGEKVREFEACFGPNAVMCNSGSSANLLAIAALCAQGSLKPGDEVIVPALCWSTTVWPLVQHGLVPVIVDIEPDTLNMDIEQASRALGSKTKAIMLVHVYGNPCNMTAFTSWRENIDLLLIEDCCEALGATYDGQLVGSFGDVSTFSFYYSHHITTGEGGMAVARHSTLAERIRILRAHGWTRDLKKKSAEVNFGYPNIDPKFLFVGDGYNLRCTEMQAAMGLMQFPKLEGFIATRRAAAATLTAGFSRFGDDFLLQQDTGESSWFGFPITIRKNSEVNTHDLRKHFENGGIETRSIICGNIARQPAMKHFEHRIPGPLTNADHVMDYGFSIGCHQGMDGASCAHVAKSLNDYMRSL